MKQSARYILLIVCLLMLIGCGKIGQVGTAPPLVFPTTQSGNTSSQAPLSIYFSVSSSATSAPTSIYAIDAAAGLLRWKVPLRGQVSGAADNLVYVNTTQGTLAALNTSDGSERWHKEVSVNATIISGWLVENTLYLGANDSTIYALNPSNGTIKWQKRLGGNFANIQTIDQGVLYVSLFNEGLAAVNASDGFILWRYKVTGGFIFVAQLINGQLYGAYGDPNNPANQGYLFSMNSKDGTIKWRYPVPSSGAFPVVG